MRETHWTMLTRANWTDEGCHTWASQGHIVHLSVARAQVRVSHLSHDSIFFWSPLLFISLIENIVSLAWIRHHPNNSFFSCSISLSLLVSLLNFWARARAKTERLCKRTRTMRRSGTSIRRVEQQPNQKLLAPRTIYLIIALHTNTRSRSEFVTISWWLVTRPQCLCALISVGMPTVDSAALSRCARDGNST